MKVPLDADRALEIEDDDQFGFVGIAKRLAPSIIEASKGDGMVIGLEGRWGSGKTSLLNFLRKELASKEAENIHTITVAPWLNGDAASLVMSLLDPITEILESKEDALNKANGTQVDDLRDKANDLGKLLRSYGVKTARRLVPLASLAGAVVPAAQVAANVIEAAANAFDSLSGPEATPTDLKESISERIRTLDIGFVVILDDLDRLEPQQAVEVIRLVRSVADFPKVAYLMCYDRKVMAHALKKGLKVKDGNLFLQKVVQLTFTIPLPEPFDLRSLFLREAISIYYQVMGEKPKGELYDDLAYAVDHEGINLATPREVKLSLNGIRFMYPSVAADVYFPDFCRLHLIKTTNFKLYQWLEEYLSERSILVTGDGIMSKSSKASLGQRLQKLMPSKEVGSSHSIWHLNEFVPGVINKAEPEDRVFSEVSARDTRDAVESKRLGSPFHYRFYFALTGPKTVMPDSVFEDLLRKAREDVVGLAQELSHYAGKVRRAGRTWFEHILDRMDESAIETLDADTIEGFVSAVADTMDLMMLEDSKAKPFVLSVGTRSSWVIGGCFRRLAKLDHSRHDTLAIHIVQDGKAINWLVGRFLRLELRSHGRLGDKGKSQEERFFSEELLDALIKVISARITSEEVFPTISNMPNLALFLYGWRDLAGLVAPRNWVAEQSLNDDRFLYILEQLRGLAVSDRVYRPLYKSSIAAFFDVEETVQRLASLRTGKHKDQIIELETAIMQASE